MTERLVWSFMLFLLCIMPAVAQETNAPQDGLLQTYTEVATLGRGKVIEARWRSDGQAFLVSTHLGGWLYAADFTLLHHFPGIGPSALSPDGRFVATVTAIPYQLLIWDAESYALLKAFDLAAERDWAGQDFMAWSPDTSHIAVTIYNATEPVPQSVEIFNVASGQHIRSFDVASYITHLAWRPDGQRLAISQLGPVLIIDPFHEQPETTVSVDTGSSMTLWSPDQQALATIYVDNYGYGPLENNLKLWTVDGKALTFVIQEYITTTLAWHPEERIVATGRQNIPYGGLSGTTYSVTFWDTTTGELIDFLPASQGLYRAPFRSVDWSPDGTQLLTASDDNVVRIYDWPLRQKKQPRELVAGQNSITGLAWNAEGTQIVSTSEDGNILIQDVTTGTPLTRLKAPKPRLNSVDWNSVTGQMAFGTNSASVYTWETQAKEPLSIGTHGENHDNPSTPEVTLVDYSPDGQWLASAAPDYTIKLWSVEDPDTPRTLGRLERAVFSLAWSADSRKLAYNSDLAHVYDLKTETTKSFECASNNIIGSVAISPDGRYLATANVGDGMCIWDTESPTLITDWPVLESLNAGYIDVGKMAWHPDGTSLALVSLRKHTEAGSEIREWFVEIWAVPAGEQLASIPMKRTMYLTEIVWSADGTRLAAGDSDGLIHIWQQP